ncbi:MAG TPA: hypothetical protein VFM59_04445 [Salinimicrobium sp.]|nr:hypothetical protein [Salinimicrobium sp.]
MKAASLKEIKTELDERSPEEWRELCLRLARFKKENKELLTYLLLEADDEEEYVKKIKAEVDGDFGDINTRNYYFIKKSLRKILRNLKKYIRYSSKKETEVELILYFCTKMQEMQPPFRRDKMLRNIYDRQMVAVKKKITALHEDLQHDYQIELENLEA